MKRLTVMALLLVSMAAVSLQAQEEAAPAAPPADAGAAVAAAAGGGSSDIAAAVAASGFGLSFDLGYAPLYSTVYGKMVNWQHVGIKPELKLGDFGVGLNLDINFRFDGGTDGSSFEIRTEDWVPTDFSSFLQIYLPKIRYISYGSKGKPLYALLGDLKSGYLGNGFIVNGYDNTLFQPGERKFGLSFDLDGALFGFPWVGIETMVGNLAVWDVMGLRVYARPGAKTGVPLLEGMQVGFTIAGDTNPYFHSPVAAVRQNTAQVGVVLWGIDIMSPMVTGDIVNLILYGDFAMQNTQFGAQIGARGNLFKFLNYGAAIRYTALNFKAGYFGSIYDVTRERLLAAYQASAAGQPQAGWQANLGFTLADGALYFNAGMNGPFVVDPNAVASYPDLDAVLSLKPGLLAGLGIEARYHKAGIDKIESLVDPTNAVIGAKISYTMGPAQLGLVYSLTYDPYGTAKGLASNWIVQSRLETSIVLFGAGGI